MVRLLVLGGAVLGLACAEAVEEYPDSVLACNCGCGGTPRSYCAVRDCACAKTGVAEPETELARVAGCACGCDGSVHPACAHRGCDCSHAADGSAPEFDDSSGQEESVAACSCGCGGSPRPYCAYKDCACARSGAASPEAVRAAIASCPCGCGGTPRPYCAHRGCVCTSATVDGEPAAPFVDPRVEPAASEAPAG